MIQTPTPSPDTATKAIETFTGLDPTVQLVVVIVAGAAICWLGWVFRQPIAAKIPGLKNLSMAQKPEK